ncbi:MAG: pyridoxamine 5'-phosphate oxidase family protein [Alistipes sp.]|nr:pyridoxamine 5'-phosphate oxidase family protein [Alistipes sp.]MBQ3209847.1 pyridoxamine 5'-phosphate oxidase family protein [Alistipes sp.]MBQ7952829.1 pyridoxamine 5'-phosphate oxidase family protein [Alistipes sp.]
MLPEKRITDFMARHHVLTLATATKEGVPYCAACFYAYDKSRNLIVFTSDDSTLHAQQMVENSSVAVAINLETRIVGKVQGIQICGTVRRGEEADKSVYIKRFPYAAVAPLNIWVVEPTFMKLTDNTLGFGKKLIWNR